MSSLRQAAEPSQRDQPCKAGITDAEIRESDYRQWPTLPEQPHNTPFVRMSRDDWRLDLEGIGHFRASSGNLISWDRWSSGVASADLIPVILSSCLGALLIQRQRLALMGTTLERDGRAIMVIGSNCSGRSTLSYLLLQKGWRLLSSGMSCLDAQLNVLKGLQQLWLWLDTVQAFGLDTKQLPRIRSQLQRFAFTPKPEDCAMQPASLHAIYLLSSKTRRPPTGKSSDLQLWRSTSNQRSLVHLRSLSFQPRFYRGMGQEANLFLGLSKLIHQKPLYFINVPEGISALKGCLEGADLFDPENLPGFQGDDVGLHS